MSNVKVTVIAPVHNSQKYLRRCLASALVQTLTDIEILCIDSSSTDECLAIVSELQKTDERIRYIKDPNSSYGHKLNIGIDLAQGRYVAVLETDDEMYPDMLQKLYLLAEEYHCDVIDSEFAVMFDYGGKKFCAVRESYSGKCSLVKGVSKPFQAVKLTGIWTALYRRNFLLEHKIKLNESLGAAYQDTSFLFLTNLLAQSVYHLDEPLYQYRMDNIGSSVKDNKKIYEIISEFQFLKQELKGRNIEDTCVWNAYYVEKYQRYHWNYWRLSKESRALFLEGYLDELRKDIHAGAINRAMFDEVLYNQTFLLLDDFQKFKTIVAERDRHKPINEICEVLDRIEVRKVIVFGAGVLGRQVIDILEQNGTVPLGICDNAKNVQGQRVCGIEVRSVEETVKNYPDAYYLIVNRKHGHEMMRQLIENGVNMEQIEIFE